MQRQAWHLPHLDGHPRGPRLVGILDAHMGAGGFHMNVNVLNRATLEDAMEHPEKYPELTIRVSGYAVNFVRLTREQQLDARIERYRDVVTTAGGGVTLTGGEPLLQPAFTAAVLRRCRELGLHTALDTSGFLGARATDELLADTDLVLLDIKSFDVATYRKLTGGSLAPTLSLAIRLDRLGIPVHVRYVLVPGWTDAPEAVDGLGAFLAGLGNVDRVDVLPFHKLGARKYDALGLSFPLGDTRTPDPELTERVREQFREHGLRAL
ncbi:glycine radical domain-containing protein [Streptomyces cupreus]|uniref:glycine radical domain-containing protein n=1 Tax=Streptomyces cupreus TaxID=2759956 RepID=UPI0021B3A2A8|nr:glycine radical domain-containing protein [Streptomyces cupreus]